MPPRNAGRKPPGCSPRSAARSRPDPHAADHLNLSGTRTPAGHTVAPAAWFCRLVLPLLPPRPWDSTAGRSRHAAQPSARRPAAMAVRT
jgi:hypothetical protein